VLIRHSFQDWLLIDISSLSLIRVDPVHHSILDWLLFDMSIGNMEERDKLRKAVQTDRLKANLRPCMNKYAMYFMFLFYE